MDVGIKKNNSINNLNNKNQSPLLYEAVDYNLLLVNYKTLNVITNYELVNQFMQKNGQKGLVIFDVPKNADFSDLKSWPNLKGIFFEYADENLLAQGFKAIEQGELWFPRPVTDCWTRKMLEEEQHTTLRTNNLTRKEIKVLKLLYSGLEYTAIADSLFISEATVRVHLHKIYQKIEVKNKQQARIWCKTNFNKISS
ncbi:helix-turn-helix transcriptional regulator [Marinomonas rhizomae]|uniref:Regulatory LuxR family protein n=1 Tax=Marinomonas rhizomae TaxID=491948 RepID=A0A366J6C4_9GAMM|nr:LuxR C-terminal-related transcriptional regulator [Marinomonas rhizomae]RBP82583.1 regulatory LuxR family protein [Marinomonas rhizomae]RNF73632.1 helix-turn-helix transcriptional regulator [Marinomonas rhizomae]